VPRAPLEKKLAVQSQRIEVLGMGVLSRSVLVHRAERGHVVVSTPSGVVRLSSVEARQLAVDHNRASLPERPEPPVESRGLVVRGIIALVSYSIPVALFGIFFLLGMGALIATMLGL
jgi:hypothetical protein